MVPTYHQFTNANESYALAAINLVNCCGVGGTWQQNAPRKRGKMEILKKIISQTVFEGTSIKFYCRNSL